MPRQEDIQKLIELYNRRLQKLREQEALKGINAPPEILIEIKDIEDKLTGLQVELETTFAQSVSPLTDDEVARELARLSNDKPVTSSSTQMGAVNLSNVSSSTITAGGDIVGRDKITASVTTDLNLPQSQLGAALMQWRQELETIISKLDDEDDRKYAAKTADKIIEEAKKHQTVNPEKIEDLLKKVSSVVPDILEMTMAILQNAFKNVGLRLTKHDDHIKFDR